MAPFFTFVVLASGGPLTASTGKEHYELTNALQKTEEPEFTEVVRKRLSGIASRWLTTFAKPAEPACLSLGDLDLNLASASDGQDADKVIFPEEPVACKTTSANPLKAFRLGSLVALRSHWGVRRQHPGCARRSARLSRCA
jgi:hypothetical protein